MKTVTELVDMYERNIGMAEEWLSLRGLTPADVAPYRLGVVDDDSPESRPYRGRLAIPYLTPAGPIDIRYRALGDRGPKYLSRPGATSHLFNVGALWRDSDVIAVCEGEFDAMVMDAFSGVPAVGAPGVESWKKHWRRLFHDYDRVLVLGDGDEAGREFAARLASTLPNAIPVQIGKGMDINDIYREHGSPALGRLVAA